MQGVNKSTGSPGRTLQYMHSSCPFVRKGQNRSCAFCLQRRWCRMGVQTMMMTGQQAWRVLHILVGFRGQIGFTWQEEEKLAYNQLECLLHHHHLQHCITRPQFLLHQTRSSSQPCNRLLSVRFCRPSHQRLQLMARIEANLKVPGR